MIGGDKKTNHSSNHLSSGTHSISMALQNPNKNLIKIRNWNTDLRFEEEQIFFLKLFKKEFLDLEIWTPKFHEVSSPNCRLSSKTRRNLTMPSSTSK
jgi:hypothetical protein